MDSSPKPRDATPTVRLHGLLSERGDQQGEPDIDQRWRERERGGWVVVVEEEKEEGVMRRGGTGVKVDQDADGMID